jgi:hypothetical protein
VAVAPRFSRLLADAACGTEPASASAGDASAHCSMILALHELPGVLASLVASSDTAYNTVRCAALQWCAWGSFSQVLVDSSGVGRCLVDVPNGVGLGFCGTHVEPAHYSCNEAAHVEEPRT